MDCAHSLNLRPSLLSCTYLFMRHGEGPAEILTLAQAEEEYTLSLIHI